MHSLRNNGLKYSKVQELNLLFNKICFWGITIDILFLPYLSFMVISASVVLVALWLFCNYKKIISDREGCFLIIMLVLMFFGTCACLAYTGKVRFETSFVTAIKRFFQFGLCFGVYFFYKDYFAKHEVDLEKIIFVTIIFIAMLAILFQLFPHEYAMLKIIVNPADNHTRRYLANSVSYRFNYFWTDPNNISYLVAGLSAWYLLQPDVKNMQKFVVLIASTYIAFCTVSNGGLIMLLAMCGIMFFITIKNTIKNGIKAKKLFFILMGIIFIIVVLKTTNILNVIKTDYIFAFGERLSHYSTNVSGGRLSDLLYSFEFLNPIMLILGTGNEGFAKEIGHIYWIGMYGLPAYFIFIWLMFRKIHYQKWEQYIWIIPFFVGFTMNIAIGEYKWMAIYLMILAYNRRVHFVESDQICYEE